MKDQATHEAIGTSTSFEPTVPNDKRREAINRGDMRALEDDLVENVLDQYTEKELGFY